jgi:hypothetical protein
MPDYTATIALAESGYTTDDVTAINAEYIIDNAINFVNLEAQLSISALSGTAGSKTVTLTRDQYAVVSILSTAMLRETKKTSLTNSTSTGTSTSGSIGAGSLSLSESSSVSSAISAAASLNSGDDFLRELFWRGIEKLRQTESDYSRAFL